MSAEELRTLSKSDLVTIGSHTVSHPMLPALNASGARAELRDYKSQLETLLDREVGMFCFPYGGFTAELIERCRDAGYKRVFTALPKRAFETPHEFACGRVRVDPTDWPLEFSLKIAGAYRWLPLALVIKRTLLTFGPRRLRHRGIRPVADPDQT
jgi:peptidoglycan/xylan/chitin deacetylase (PgdA/CDA1 family)